MTAFPYRTALVVGAGPGFSAAFARRLAQHGVTIDLAARNPAKLDELAHATGARAHRCDVADPAAITALFAGLATPPDLVLYNPSARTRGPLVDLDPVAVRDALMVTAYGGFLVAQHAVRPMLAARRGAVVFTGASASIKGYAQSAPFAMGKFALRGLAQSLARELQPQGIHVLHLVIDGAIRSARYAEPADQPDSLLDPDAIAQAALALLAQPRSAWSWELDVRPWVEKF